MCLVNYVEMILVCMIFFVGLLIVFCFRIMKLVDLLGVRELVLVLSFIVVVVLIVKILSVFLVEIVCFG